MKKYLLSIIILLNISSNATAQTNKIDSPITLPASILRKTIIDLELGDAAKKENTILYSNIRLLNTKLSLKDSIITSFGKKENYYNGIISNHQQINIENLKFITQLQNDNKKLKAENTWNKIIYYGIIGGLGYAYIRK